MRLKDLESFQQLNVSPGEKIRLSMTKETMGKTWLVDTMMVAILIINTISKIQKAH